mgnify:FL=1
MDNAINYSEIGMRIRRQRERAGMTQEQLGEACDLSTSFIGHIERGSRKLSVESLYKLAAVLDVSVDYLLFDRMLHETSLPADISVFLEGSSPDKQKQFWRTVKTLACHLDEL